MAKSAAAVVVANTQTEVNPNHFTGIKVFSATKAQERMYLGETITDWMRQNPKIEVVDKVVTQSSDNEFHCLAVTIFYRDNL